MGAGFVNGAGDELELKTYTKQDCTFRVVYEGSMTSIYGNTVSIYSNRIEFPKGVTFKDISSIEICQKSRTHNQYYYIVKLSNSRIGLKSPQSGGIETIRDWGDFACKVFVISGDSTFMCSPYSLENTFAPIGQGGVSDFNDDDIQYVNITALK